MKYEHISIMAAIMWEILTVLVSGAILFLILFVFAPYTWLWYLLLWLWGALTVLAVCLYVPFLYLNTEFALSETAMIYKKGVIFPSTQILYRERIVFVTIYNNPLSAILHVSTLAITAVGGNMTILFLNSRRARELADSLARDYLDDGTKKTSEAVSKENP